MPTVPMYDQPTQQLDAGNFTPVQAPEFQNYAGRQIEALGQSTTAIGKAAMQIAQYVQDKNDDAKTKELFNSAAAEIDQARSEYLNTSDKNAVDGLAGYKAKIAEIVNSHQEKAENEVQAGMFAMSAATISRSAISSMNDHQLKELNQYDMNETQKKIETGVNSAITHFGQKDQDVFVGSVYSDINHYADMQGWPADSAQRKALTDSANDKIIQGAVKSALAQNQPSRAKLFLDEATKAGAISETMHTELSSLVQVKSAQDTAARLSQTLPGSESQKKKKINEMFMSKEIDVTTRDAAIGYIEHDAAQAEQERNKAEKTIIGQAQDWVLQHPGVDITTMPPGMYSALRAIGQLGSMTSLADRLGKPVDENKALVTRGKLLQLASQDQDEFLRQFNTSAFNQYTNDLGIQGTKEMQTLAAGMIEGKGTYYKGFDKAFLEEAIPPAVLKNADQKHAFIAIQYEAITQWKQENPGKLPTIEDQKRIAQSANANWVNLSGWNSRNVPAYKIRANNDQGVPQDFYDQGKKAGKSDDEIIKLWSTQSSKNR